MAIGAFPVVWKVELASALEAHWLSVEVEESGLVDGSWERTRDCGWRMIAVTLVKFACSGDDGLS